MKNKNTTILKLENVCLCAIVRDEEMNPAGGITDFVNCALPFVGSAVVVDTGSTDKTRELLTQAQQRFPHLRVFDYQFDGYAQARNFSLEQTRTHSLGEYALVLDADERLFAADFKKLQKLLLLNPIAINFKLKNIWADYRSFKDAFYGDIYGAIINPRCFSLKQNLYFEPLLHGATGETLCTNATGTSQEVEYLNDTIKSGIEIKHFQPTMRGREYKREEWYTRLWRGFLGSQKTLPHFADWKKLNPRRADYPTP